MLLKKVKKNISGKLKRHTVDNCYQTAAGWHVNIRNMTPAA